MNHFSLDDINSLSEAYSVTSNTEVKEQLLSKIKDWDNGVQSHLNKENIFFEEQQKFKIAKRSLKQNNALIKDIEKDLSNFQSLAKKTKTSIQKDYWFKDIEKLKKLYTSKKSKTVKQKKKEEERQLSKCLISRTLLQEQWGKLLDKEYVAWELKTLDEYRRKFLEKIKNWLELLQKLFDTLNDLSLNPGLLFDLSKGNISLSDIEVLKKWVEYISKDEGVKKLCDMMGRLKIAETNKRKELIKQIHITQEFIPDIDSKEEITGIRLGNDIEYALPHELALLGDEEISILFDMKFIEKRLLCFDMEGIQQKNVSIEKEVMAEVEYKEELGPIILCVDTSGSMHGAPETIAKAITLFMSTRAIEQKRKCFLINFSTSIETLDLSESMGMSKVIQFLQRSFNGGTDATPALEYATKLMKSKDYKKSDLLMISDFVMGELPKTLIEKIKKAHLNENKFYSLAIGDLFIEHAMKDIFNKEWVYNPDSQNIQTLQSVADTITS